MVEKFTEISIIRAFSELKLLDKKINKAIKTAHFVGERVKNKKIDLKYTEEEFRKNAISSWDSIISLIKKYREIKSAISVSNAITKIKINGVEMVVAEAIEHKKNIEYDKLLLSLLKRQLSETNVRITQNNSYSKERLDSYMQNNNMGKDNSSIKLEDYNKFKEIFENSNDYILVDPLNAETKIKELEEKIDIFEAEIDHVLTESNTITKIKIKK